MKTAWWLGVALLLPLFTTAQVKPLDAPLIISGAFGEPRDNHFHTGIDFTTRRKTGIKVFAFNDGYISRIKVSSVGYGKALYISHTDGTMTVYGHLEKFNDAIEQYVIDEQYKAQKFEVELYPSKEKFQLKKGDVIAYSGNSGGSSAPHLHFEVRDASGESFPLNPLAHKLYVKDTIAPTLRSMVFYDRSGATEKQLREYPLAKKGSRYTAGNDTIKANTPAVAFGIRTDDLANGCDADGFFGVYSIEATVDGQPFYKFSADRLDFAEGRCANAHIDYKRRKSTKQRVYRLYKLPGNVASVYTTTKPFLTLNDDKLHDITVTVKDFNGNTATYSFFIRNISGKTIATQSYNDKNFVQHDKPFDITSDNFKIHCDAGTFYDDFSFDWSKISERGSNVTSTYDVGDTFVPVHKSFTLWLKPEINISEALRGQCVVMRGSNAYTTEWNDGWLVAKPKEFGSFKAVIDTTPPRLSPVNFKNSGNGPTKPKLAITDSQSGVKDYDIYVDGKWTLTEYDAKDDLLTVKFKQELSSGVHEIKAVVSDKVGNKKAYTFKLTY